jgi:hypothetical protein
MGVVNEVGVAVVAMGSVPRFLSRSWHVCPQQNEHKTPRLNMQGSELHARRGCI